MSDQDKQEAKELAGRAGRQGRHALKNTGRAAVAAGEAAADGAADAAHDAADTVQRVAPRISTRGLAALSGDAGTGFLALSVTLYAGVIAYNKFSAVYKGRGRAVTP